MIQPAQKDDVLLADVAHTDVGDGFALWWLGQSGFLLQCRAGSVLFDPYLSDSLRRKYAGTDRPHDRMTAIGVDPARLDFIDVVTSSHAHTDHLDAETLLPLFQANANLQLLIPEAARAATAERLGIAPDGPIGLDDGQRVELAALEFCGVAAAHETIDRDEQGRCKYLGYVVRFGRWSIYHAGDTIPYDGMIERLRPMNVDVALLPINGRAPERGVPGNLTGEEAAELAHAIGARLAIPCHYDMFRFNTATPAPFVAACRRLGQPHRVLQCGEKWKSQSG
ncbi:MAG: MBL fold metallo-hydrolase [Candidatus Nealsonbacteria bacterium]|nr:MBL fold metallo-hydrolase [Candidatus Nealsonbacteria bacterium]